MIISKVCQGLKQLQQFNNKIIFTATTAKPSKPISYYYQVLGVKEGFTPE